MLPGFLHFDLHHGLKIELINGALFELANDQQCILDALDSLGFQDIDIEVMVEPNKGSRLNIRALPPKTDSLSDIKALFSSKKVDVAISSLALPILANIPQVFETSLEHSWLMRELAILCSQIAKLDPKFISASKVRTGTQKISKIPSELLIGIPVMEVEAQIRDDFLALAFLKTVVGQWGARGEHTLLNVGLGYDQGETVEALWCEARLPESMNEIGPSNQARMHALFEVIGHSPCTMDMPGLATTLFLHGAKDFSWHLVQGENHLSSYQVRFFCSGEDKRDSIEAFLIKGEAHRVSVRLVELHELNRRQVAIPLGTGNKTSSMRFWEYIYYDKIVRVEPVREDLDQYIIKTDYSVDVARSDALLLWKKWRGRAAEDK